MSITFVPCDFEFWWLDEGVLDIDNECIADREKQNAYLDPYEDN